MNLEKDEPKKPCQDLVNTRHRLVNARYRMGYEYYEYFCPTCKSSLCFEPQLRQFKEKKRSRCPICGQLIIWEDVQ